MKKTSIFLSLMAASAISVAQTTRLSLFEEFTGENCNPCAATNPGLQTVLNANTSKCVAIKWQVPIPSAPTNTWSLYKTNQTEIDWRYKPTPSGYGYMAQYTPTDTPTGGINSAPTGFLDGQHQWNFGATSDHPAYTNATVIGNAQAIMSPFAVTMNRAWNPTYTAVTVTVNITAAQNFTPTGALVYRLCMVEQVINYATAPGTNGEKDFYNAVRASFPSIQAGTPLTPGAWTSGQTQTFTVNCTLPSYIVDKSQVNFVGFIQDDGNKKVLQAARTTTVGIANDAAVSAISGSYLNCGTSYNPQVTIFNAGTNAITAFTLNPALDGVGTTPYTWTGSLAAGASTVVTMPSLSPSYGNHSYSVNIGAVSGGDVNSGNNTKAGSFGLVSSYSATPITQNYTSVTFPPANWMLYNPDLGAYTWSRGTPNGYGVAGTGSAKYDFYDNGSVGDADDLYLPGSDFTGITNPQLTFDVAYAQYSNENDKLEVKVSSNCGSTWSTVYSKAGSVLMTAAPTTSAFSPSATQWRTETVNLSAYANMPQVLVKFVATSAYGNNLYVDNINLAQPTGVKNIEDKNINGVDLYPNPAQNEANVNITLVKESEITVTVMNNLGQVVSKQTSMFNGGVNTITLDTRNYASGIYNIMVSSNEGSTVKKLTIAK